MGEREKMPPGMMVYFVDAEALESLSGDDYKSVFVSLFAFARNGELAEGLSPVADMAFRMMKPKVEADVQRYSEKCDRNRKNIMARWDKKDDTTKYERIPPYTTEYKRIPNIPNTTTTPIPTTTSIANATVNSIGVEESEREPRPSAPQRHKYGEYKNVLLSDDELEKVKSEFPYDWENRIDRLSEYIASTGKKYKSHLATIRTWARKEGGNSNGNDNGRLGKGVDRSPYILPGEIVL